MGHSWSSILYILQICKRKNDDHSSTESDNAADQFVRLWVPDGGKSNDQKHQSGLKKEEKEMSDEEEKY